MPDDVIEPGSAVEKELFGHDPPPGVYRALVKPMVGPESALFVGSAACHCVWPQNSRRVLTTACAARWTGAGRGLDPLVG